MKWFLIFVLPMLGASQTTIPSALRITRAIATNATDIESSLLADTTDEVQPITNRNMLHSYGANVSLSDLDDIDFEGMVVEYQKRMSTISPFIGSTNSLSEPYIDSNVPTNVTVTVGQTAYFHCKVMQLNKYAVSWLRKDVVQILTTDVRRHTNDNRFSVIRRGAESTAWILQIKSVQSKDAGKYECQINTTPKTHLEFTLNVIEAEARIIGEREVYAPSGGSVTFLCAINQRPYRADPIGWYKGNQSVSKLRNERFSQLVEWNGELLAKLTIVYLTSADSGNYSCVPSTAKTATLVLHVVSGEHPAAMHHGNTSTSMAGKTLTFLTIYYLSVYAMTTVTIAHF